MIDSIKWTRIRAGLYYGNEGEYAVELLPSGGWMFSGHGILGRSRLKRDAQVQCLVIANEWFSPTTPQPAAKNTTNGGN